MTLAEAPRPEIHPEAIATTRTYHLPLKPCKVMSKDNARFAIAGAQVGTRGLLAATDGKKLLAAVLSPSDGKPASPPKDGRGAFGVYDRSAFEGSTTLRVGAESLTGIGKKGARIDGAAIEGTFPPFMDVIPKQEGTQQGACVCVSIAQLRAMLEAFGDADAVAIILDPERPETKPVSLLPYWTEGLDESNPVACVGVMMPVTFNGGLAPDGKDQTPHGAWRAAVAKIGTHV